ncbi:MAG: hypothetical protein ACR2JA_12085 [Hydrogenophaga sp.]
MPASSRVQRRCVLYVSGFDPRGASHYHALYRDESARQTVVNGLAVEVGPRRRDADGNPQWPLVAQDGDQAVSTDYVFLRWDDVVRRHWPRSDARVWVEVARTSWHYLQCGALARGRQLAKGPIVVLAAFFAQLFLLLAGLPLGALAVFAGLRLGGVDWPVASAGAAAFGVALLMLIHTVEKRMNMRWLARGYVFPWRQERGAAPELDARLDAHARTLIRRVRSGDYDEVLVVGHSLGCMLACSIVARALAVEPSLATGRTVLSLLTLGQWIPLQGLLPEAQRFRGELACLGTAAGLHWVDASAPPDGCCFPLCDPLAAVGLAPAGRQPGRPVLISPRFVRMFGADAYARLRRDKFRLHFQYLMASDLLTDYDYFRITAGSRTLAHLFPANTP